MIFNYYGDDDNPIVEVALRNNEKIRLESGAMVYMQDVALEGKANADKGGVGGFFKALGRAIATGESFFITTATGQSDAARIGIAPAVPGTIAKLEVGERQYRLNTGAFLACDETVTYEVKSQSFGKALFGGTGGLFIMETKGYGDLLVNAFSSMIELTVTPDRPLVIDNMHVVAWDSTLDYEIRPASGIIGFKSGEGLVNEFKGNGRVLVQTRNIYNLAMQISPYIPKSSS
jgi:uncharacterized protein (TIGR00266 family)